MPNGGPCCGIFDDVSSYELVSKFLTVGINDWSRHKLAEGAVQRLRRSSRLTGGLMLHDMHTVLKRNKDM